MKLQKVKLTSGNTFLYNEVPNKIFDNLNIIFGTVVALYAHLTKTSQNPRGTWSYTNSISKNIPLFNKADIVSKITVTPEDTAIYETLAHGNKLNSKQKLYLQNNYPSELQGE